MALHFRPTLGVLIAVLSLCGCAGQTPYEKLMAAKPTGSPFTRALYDNYAALALSLKIASLPGTTAFDADSAIALDSIPAAQANLALAYAAKAELAAQGDEVLPEPAPTDHAAAELQRQELLRALVNGRSKAPADAARAQAQYDCWVMDGAIPALAPSAAACLTGLMVDLAQLKAIPGAMLADGATQAAPEAAASGVAPLKTEENSAPSGQH